MVSLLSVSMIVYPLVSSILGLVNILAPIAHAVSYPASVCQSVALDGHGESATKMNLCLFYVALGL